MPLQVVSFPVQPNTPATAPAQTVIRPGALNLASISVLFPGGCLGVVGVRFSLGGVQFAPLTGWLHGNDEVVTWPENRSLGPDPRVVIDAYSDAIDWPHTLEIRLTFL
jgi:hypothetical protein